MAETVSIDDDPALVVLSTNHSELEFSAELLHSGVYNPDLHAPYMTVTRAANGHGCTGHGQYEYPDCQVPPGGFCFANAIVRLSNGMQEWIYEVNEYNTERNSWIARWPD